MVKACITNTHAEHGFVVVQPKARSQRLRENRIRGCGVAYASASSPHHLLMTCEVAIHLSTSRDKPTTAIMAAGPAMLMLKRTARGAKKCVHDP